MGRFSDNPLRSLLQGNEDIPFTDPNTLVDGAMTPVAITQFAQSTMAVATGTSNGLMSAAQATLLNSLYTAPEIDAKVAALAECAVPIFFADPVDGSASIYTHVLDQAWTFSFAFLQCSAGSTNLTVTSNGVPLGGLNNVPVTSVSSSVTVVAPNQLVDGSTLGITLSGTTGNCKNVAISLKAVQSTP